MSLEHLRHSDIDFSMHSRLSGATFEWASDESDQTIYLRKKTATDKNKLLQQYQWLNQLKDSNGIPKTKNPIVQGQSFSYEIEFLHDHLTLDKFLSIAKITEAEMVLENIFSALCESIYSHSNWSDNSTINEYFQLKLIRKLEQCHAIDRHFKFLLNSPTIVINGNIYNNFPFFKKELENFVGSNEKSLSRSSSCLIHGDLTAENILVGSNSNVFFIDPNPDTNFSTPVVDLAKLWQSFDSGFELNKNTPVSLDGATLSYEEVKNEDQWRARDILTTHFKNRFDVSDEEILLHQIIHLARLLPYAMVNSKNLFLWSYSKFVVLSNRLLYPTNA